jgi:hypothetical protein
VTFKNAALPIALLAAGVLSTNALAATNPIIDWSGPESQAYEPGFVMPFNSQNGAELTIVGRIQTFQNPLNGNVPSAGVEYTFVFDQLISNGVETDNGAQWVINYTGGRFRVFEDNTPDRVYTANPPNATVPSTFTDGTLILEATVSNFRTLSNKFTNGGNYGADLYFTGGTQLALLGTERCGNLTNSLWNRTGILTTGYIRSADGHVNVVACAVPAENSTWGGIKARH